MASTESGGAGVSAREVEEDVQSEVGFFEAQVPTSSERQPLASQGGGKEPAAGAVPSVKGFSKTEGVLRRAPQVTHTIGRGAVPVDPRKFKYDRIRGGVMPALAFGATRADRMDAAEAGQMLDALHVMFGIDREEENVLTAFDRALFFEHSVNGASLLQEGRGYLTVGNASFELKMVKTKLGKDQRRFFRAYADEIADVNASIIKDYDAYDPESAEKVGQIMAVAVERGLQKYPHLIHDSADAGLRLSVEERLALNASKRLVLPSVVNKADKLAPRTPATVEEGEI